MNLFTRIGETVKISPRGRAYRAALWTSNCQQCGRPFVIATPAHLGKVAQRKLCTTRCEAHRLTREEVLQRMRIGYRRWLEERRAEREEERLAEREEKWRTKREEKWLAKREEKWLAKREEKASE